MCFFLFSGLVQGLVPCLILFSPGLIHGLVPGLVLV